MVDHRWSVDVRPVVDQDAVDVKLDGNGQHTLEPRQHAQSAFLARGGHPLRGVPDVEQEPEMAAPRMGAVDVSDHLWAKELEPRHQAVFRRVHGGGSPVLHVIAIREPRCVGIAGMQGHRGRADIDGELEERVVSLCCTPA